MTKSIAIVSLFSVLCFLPTFVQAETEAEKQAELERKEAATKGTGLDPTEVIGRIEFNYTYSEFKDGAVRHSGILVLDKDISDTSVVGVEVPLATAEAADGNRTNGIGDVKISFKTRVYSEGKFSTSMGAGLSFDTATDDGLGDDYNSVRLGMFNAYKHGEWLFAAINGLNITEEEEENSINIVPLIAYQPMGKYISYATVAFPYAYRFDSGDSVTTAFFHLGKVMPNKDVYSLGTKINIDGPDTEDFVLFLGYRRLF
mgnify:CR=1 FL=1